MSWHVYRASKSDSEPFWFGIRVEFDDGHWVATCRRVDEHGRERSESAAVAPAFYGVTAEQAHRRMLSVLENSYDELTPVETQGPP